MRTEISADGTMQIRDMADDMGGPLLLDQVASKGGDVTFTLKERDSGKIIGEFTKNNGQGGTVDPGVARSWVRAMREIITGEDQPDFLIR